MWRRRLAWALLALALLLGLAWSQRITVLKYSLGWLTDWQHPRGPERPVPWQSGPTTGGDPAKRPPNIIVILADDLGINDVTTHGGGHRDWGLDTPHIDRLAREGVRFDQGYANSAVCTVSRAALLTGRYPWRFGVEFTPTPGALARVAGELYPYEPPALIDRAVARRTPPFNDLGMPASEITLAEVLKARGYHTVHIGKWHLGSTPAMRPNNQGFDETLFMESGLYLREDDPRVVNSYQPFDPIDNFLWPNMRLAVSYNGGDWFEPGNYLTDYFTDQALLSIERNRHRPFLLYLAHWGVHAPLQASRTDYDALAQIPNHRERVYAAMIRSIDRSVGRVLQQLDALGLADNTLVVFSSDNGAPGYIGIPSVNQPYRGWKLSFFEGGIRVPYVARWPARIPAGQRVAEPVTGMDIFATAAAAASAALPTDRVIDGIDWMPAVGGDGRTLAQRTLHWRDGPYRALRQGSDKLIAAHRPARDWLFDLRSDPTERDDRAGREGVTLQRLKAEMTRHHQGLPAPLWQSFLEVPVFIDKTLDQPHGPDDTHTYWVN